MDSETSKSKTDHQNTVDLVKQYMMDRRRLLQLDDIVTQQIKETLSRVSEDSLPVEGVDVIPEAITERLSKYEDVVRPLQATLTLLAYWAKYEHLSMIRKVIARMAEREISENGIVGWLALHRYPTVLLFYSAGIAAVAAENYDALSNLFSARIYLRGTNEQVEVALKMGEMLSYLDDSNVFRKLPEYERHYLPRSEYLFKIVEPDLETLFFLGNSYEAMFDRFEMLLTLVIADLQKVKGERVWTPVGRFALKHRNKAIAQKSPC
jgi:hypothetical protein